MTGLPWLDTNCASLIPARQARHDASNALRGQRNRYSENVSRWARSNTVSKGLITSPPQRIERNTPSSTNTRRESGKPVSVADLKTLATASAVRGVDLTVITDGP